MIWRILRSTTVSVVALALLTLVSQTSGLGKGTPSTGPPSDKTKNPQSIKSTSTAAPVTTTPASKTYYCGTTACNGSGFYHYNDQRQPIQLRCLKADYTVIDYCDSNSSTWYRLNATTLENFPCQGNFNFTIGQTNFWYTNDKVQRWSGSQWEVLDSIRADKYRYYGARLRPNEGFGSFCCAYEVRTNYFITTNKFRAYCYANGTYFDLSTNSSGYLIQRPQTTPQYIANYVTFITGDDTGCRSPACFWFTDVVNISSNGSVSAITTEMMYNGEKWYYWYNNAYNLYTGEFTQGINAYIRYFNDFSWKVANGTKYKFIGGSIYRLAIDGSVASDAINVNGGWDYWNTINDDPLATGGYYYNWPQTSMGAYKNLSGDYLVNIQNGLFVHRRKPPSCALETYKSGQSVNPSCNFTADSFKITEIIVCDPAQRPSVCGDGYKCMTVPSVFGITCVKGFCLPDYSGFCQPISTSAPTSLLQTTTVISNTTTQNTTANVTASTPTSPTTNIPMIGLQKYGSSCSFDVNCYTGICTSGKCSCTNCTRVLPALDYDWRTMSVVYKETCIPVTSAIGGLGDTCNMWADVKAKTCGFGLLCAKCPEVWNTAYARATCISLEAPKTSTVCPDSFKCGYNAKCKMIVGIPTCTCPIGYNLESNMMDCYGWNTSDIGQCNASCGLGIRQIKRVCDRSSNSTAICDGSPIVNITCSAGTPCPLEAKLLSSAVKVDIKSEVLNVHLFVDVVEPVFRQTLAIALSQKCLSDKDTFERQCCPGKEWSLWITTGDCVDPIDGFSMLNFYQEDTTFSFYLLAYGDANSVCCTSADFKSSRRKRWAEDTGGFEQAVLANILTSPPVLQSMTDAVQTVDPNAAITASAISLATTTTVATTTTNAIVNVGSTVNSKDSFEGFIGGLAYWVIGVIAGGIVLLVIIIVVTVVVIKQKRKLNTVGTDNGVLRLTMAMRQSLDRPMNTRRSQADIASVVAPAAYPPYFGQYPPGASVAMAFVPNAAHGH